MLVDKSKEGLQIKLLKQQIYYLELQLSANRLEQERTKKQKVKTYQQINKLRQEVSVTVHALFR